MPPLLSLVGVAVVVVVVVLLLVKLLLLLLTPVVAAWGKCDLTAPPPQARKANKSVTGRNLIPFSNDGYLCRYPELVYRQERGDGSIATATSSTSTVTTATILYQH